MTFDLGALTIRVALPSDRGALRAAVVELHEEERRLHDSRLPGEETADSNRFGYISDVCVLSAFRGRRLAGHLLNALESHLSHSGVRWIRLSALAANKAARTSYERSGYAPYEIVYDKAAPARI